MNNCSSDNMSIKEKMRDLYRANFDDSEQYIDYFFMYKYAQSRIYYSSENNTLLCGLHIIPKTFSLNGRLLSLPYIVAAATYPEHRRKGLMRELIKNAARDYNPILALYPFNHEYYEQFGFFSMNYVSSKTISYTADSAYITLEANANAAPRIYSLYRKFSKNFDAYLYRNEKDLEDKINEITAGGGKCIIIQVDNTDIGYAMYDREGIVETDMSYNDISKVETLDGYTYNMPHNIFADNLSEEWSSAQKNIMFLITDIKTLLDIIQADDKLLSHIDKNTVINIKDSFLEANNISFIYTDTDGINYCSAETKADKTYTTAEFGHNLFNNLRSFIMEKY
ncbi:MAG: GNAT family N-acetyltransferase [Clostridia bacterium]|nr:GNAT family N-acetyltransferase [Clostridia bacterium]